MGISSIQSGKNYIFHIDFIFDNAILVFGKGSETESGNEDAVVEREVLDCGRHCCVIWGEEMHRVRKELGGVIRSRVKDGSSWIYVWSVVR